MYKPFTECFSGEGEKERKMMLVLSGAHDTNLVLLLIMCAILPLSLSLLFIFFRQERLRATDNVISDMQAEIQAPHTQGSGLSTHYTVNRSKEN